MPLLEVCCFGPDSAIIAGQAGADRIELCDQQLAGGTTPDLAWLHEIKATLDIPVFVMIRPRGGDFNFSDAEFERMKLEMDAFKPCADGFVIGILDHARQVDVQRTAELVQRAHPLPCTFHRAFDETADIYSAIEDVITTGCRAILSSGGAPNVASGAVVLRRLVERAQGRIAIMPGGGVRSRTLARIQGMTGATVFHSSALKKGSCLPDATEIRRMKDLLLDESRPRKSSAAPILEIVSNGIASPPHEPSPVSIGTKTPIDESEEDGDGRW